MSGKRSLAVQITAFGVLVAGVVVAVAATIALSLLSSITRDVTRDSLADQADVVAGQVADAGAGSRLGLRRVVDVLQGQDVSIVLIGVSGEPSGNDSRAVRAARAADAGAAASGQAVSETVRVTGQTLLVEARPTANGAFALVQAAEPSEDLRQRVRRSIFLALGAGLAAAAIAGSLLSRVLASPLLRAAAAARRLGSGERDVRVPVEGPTEVAAVATSMNELATALQHSEARQQAFLMSVSHELRTPLTAINGFAESLADGVVSGPDTAQVGATIHREAQRLDRLVSDLLDLARVGADDFPLHLVRTDLTGLVREAAAVWSERSRARGVVMRTEAPASPVVVDVDPQRLRQVVDGLIENALRVVPPGAPIVLELTGGIGSAMLQVRDGGPGLAPEDYDVAFKQGVLRARYAGRREVGTGLGLALARGLVTRMGGTITAGPAREGGACFTISLPLRDAG